MYRDLTRGSILRSLLLFALPMLAGDILQQLYNIADTLIVSRAIGRDALAAVGSAYTLMIFLTSILLGLSMGAGALFSICRGKGDESGLRRSIVHAFALIGVCTLLLTALAYALLPALLRLLQVPESVSPLMRTYLAVIFAGIPATFLYNFFACLLRSVGNSMTPLVFSGISALGNVALDLLFVLVFPWGVAGAAWATVIAQYFSGLGLAVFTLRRCPDLLPKREELRFDAARTLLDYAFANYTLVMPETGAPDVPVSLGKAASVRAVCESSGTVLIEKAQQKELSAVYELPEKVDAPVAAGQLLGTLRYVAGNETIASVPISAAESVERVGAGELWVRLAAALCGRTNTQ